jgi:hypothetical protein
MTFKTVSKDHIELQDSHGNTIHMIRQQHVQETPESKIRNMILRNKYEKTAIPYIPPTINFTMEPSQSKECPNCAFAIFTLTNIPDHFFKYHTYKGYYFVGNTGKNPYATDTGDQLVMCAHKKDLSNAATSDHKVIGCTYLKPSDQQQQK